MRTKSVITAACFCLCTTAGIAACPCTDPVTPTSYCITVPTAWSVIANHLDIGANDLSSVFSSVTPALPKGTQIVKCYDDATKTYKVWSTWNGTTWTPPTTLAPGEGAFINNPSSAPFCVTFTGVPHVPAPLPFSQGLTFVSRQTTEAGTTYEDIVGCPPVKTTQLFRWTGVDWGLKYTFSADKTHPNGVWHPSPPPVMNVGEPVLISRPAACKNDDCADCTPLLLEAPACSTTTPNSVCVDTTSANTDGDSTCPGPGQSAHDVWYCLTPKCDGVLTLWTCNSTFDPVLSVHTGCPGTTANEIACDDDDDFNVKCSPPESYLTVPLSGGTQYWIRLAGAGGTYGYTCLYYNYAAAVPSAAPANDNPCNATAIGIGTFPGTLVSATATAGGVTPLIPGGTAKSSPPDVWYSYTPNCSGPVTIDTCANACSGPSHFDTVLSVYQGTCSFLTRIPGTYCNDDAGYGFCANNPWASKLTFDATGGKTYWIRVSGYNGAKGSFALSLTQVPTPPANDLCTKPIPVTSGVYSFNTCGAGTDGSATEDVNQDIWYKYVAPAGCPGDVTVDTCGYNGDGSFDTAIAVYSSSSGNCSTLALVPNGYNDNFCGSQSSVTFTVSPGATYFIRVGGIGTATGTGQLTIQGPTPPVGTCPGSGGIASSVTYFIRGMADHIGWSWSLTKPCCMNIQDLIVDGVDGTALDVAKQFARSINTQGNGNNCVFAKATQDLNGAVLKIFFYGCPNGSPVLKVGAKNGPPNCVVSAPLNISQPPCHFNPDIVLVELPGEDCNANGEDDLLDIANGTSQDVNFNGIPDECEPCLAPYLLSKPGSQVAQTGLSAGFTVLAQGSGPLSYQWLKDGVSLQSDANIVGANTETLTINSVDLTNAGAYQVIITNICGAITNEPASLVVITGAVPSVSLVSTGAVWKYLDTGANLGTTWTSLSFDDSAWPTGRAELGYGGADTTVVGFGPDSNNKYITTYFRQQFIVDDVSIFENIVLRLLRDDGAVVYINGQEALRSNMTNAPIDYLTLAASTISGPAEDKFYPFSISPAYLLQGTNVIAVEVHQDLPSSPDLSFDLTLEGQLPYVPASIPESIPSLIPPGPFITIDANGNQITISWSLRPGFLLQESTNLLNWQFTANPTNPYTISAPTGRKYYRLTE